MHKTTINDKTQFIFYKILHVFEGSIDISVSNVKKLLQIFLWDNSFIKSFGK